ncbi:hypothetical protein AAG906_032749 [Vitis piasezkii]|uniref:Senescence regulator n=2 Tax=Vitis vinifera TaxID=29760 RepID=A0ABY9C129_VITVI|nr:protein S40-4 [Vitis vinifera]WJZ88682.1 hypothetical protein VitviT2T_007959 [Vitis vinifera]|eukprot:XP_002285165.1 PREDICTED: uncharacterized protein LOC100253658 [Vitis vinifera]
MASGKSYYARPNYRFLSGDRDAPAITSEAVIELDESDIWSSSHSASPEFRNPVPSSRLAKKPSKRGESGDRSTATVGSLPVNIPDWSKILREDYRDNRRREADDDDDDEDDDGDSSSRVPPHEFLARQFARTRIASFSVYEGIGRTLKGRDLSRVRNAIWEKTGFQD